MMSTLWVLLLGAFGMEKGWLTELKDFAVAAGMTP